MGKKTRSPGDRSTWVSSTERYLATMAAVELYSSAIISSSGAEEPPLLDTIKRFGKTREPFAIMVAGTKYYIITSPFDASEFYANVSTLSWDGFLNETLAGFGVDATRLDVLWEKPSAPSIVNPAGKCLIHLTQDLYKQHLLPGPTFSTLIEKYKVAVSQLMTWERLSSCYGLATASKTQKISLYDFCSTIMIDATQMTLFDPVLFMIDPNMTQKMRQFTDELWKLMYPSPFLYTKGVAAIREQYTKAFLIYQRLPKEMRKGEAWVVSALIDQYKELGINENDSAAMLVMVYWTGDANAYKLAFWIMSYILFDKELYASIRTETLPAVQNDDLDLQYLANNCPRLRSVYHEALRLRKRDLAFRKVEHDTEIGGKLLRRGNFAIVPVCQLHDNEDVFGSDALDFRPERFLEQQDLTSSLSYKPYGGGKTYCPGRFFAMQEIFGFVALQIHRFDVQLASPVQKFPIPDESLLTLGVSRPVPASDVWVTLVNRRGKVQG
ncbi:MAG: hypothetical protein M1830_002144 [Pleopsidium flavum]|nr:MAG: hypothetical protein M1830_002144 [Pleopsidium flavum]